VASFATSDTGPPLARGGARRRRKRGDRRRRSPRTPARCGHRARRGRAIPARWARCTARSASSPRGLAPKHYTRATPRYTGAPTCAIDAAPLPAHLRHEVGFPDVWHVDLVEWEQGGSASQACGDIILDLEPVDRGDAPPRRARPLDRAHRGDAARRRARRRAAAGSFAAIRRAPPEAYARLAEQLALVELYTILSPLEQMYRRPEQGVRVAVVRALSRFLFKRTFITLRAALTDPDTSCRRPRGPWKSCASPTPSTRSRASTASPRASGVRCSRSGPGEDRHRRGRGDAARRHPARRPARSAAPRPRPSSGRGARSSSRSLARRWGG
jgi:hypothetical protein